MKGGTIAPVILNFLPISKGGGLQNALSFVDTLRQERGFRQNAVAVVRRDTALHEMCCDVSINTIPVAADWIGRFRFEMLCRNWFRRQQTCFTLFGPVMLASSGYLLNVVGCAYSNLFYPEIDFWSELPKGRRCIARAIDSLRRRFTAKADYWIFETPVLKSRAIELCGFPESRVAVVPMAVSRLVSARTVVASVQSDFEKRLPNAFRLLFLNGPNPNKRIHFLPQLALQLARCGAPDFVFVTTMDADETYTQTVAAEARRLGVERYFINIGPVPSSAVSSLISCVSAVCTFSRLESFSNNFTEAWAMERPLIVAKADWALAACGSGALYVNLDNLVESASEITRLMQDSSLRRRLVSSGRRRLDNHPTASEKTEMYLRIIDRVQALGPCSRELRKRIRWAQCASPMPGLATTAEVTETPTPR